MKTTVQFAKNGAIYSSIYATSAVTLLYVYELIWPIIICPGGVNCPGAFGFIPVLLPLLIFTYPFMFVSGMVNSHTSVYDPFVSIFIFALIGAGVGAGLSLVSKKILGKIF
jgi:hypothetical protein